MRLYYSHYGPRPVSLMLRRTFANQGCRRNTPRVYDHLSLVCYPLVLSGIPTYAPGIMMPAAGVPPTPDRRGQTPITYSYPDYGSAGPAGRSAPPPPRNEPSSMSHQPEYGRDFHQPPGRSIYLNKIEISALF